MGRWEGTRTKITNFITKNGSTITITPKTPTEGNYGGYEPSSDNSGTAVSTVGIVSSYITGKATNPFGKLKTGELSLAIKYSETVDKDYEITWQSQIYSIKEIQELKADDVITCKLLKLSRKFN